MGRKNNRRKRKGGGQDGGPHGRAAPPPTHNQLQNALRNAHKKIDSLTEQIRQSLEEKESMANKMQKDKLRIAHLEECVEIPVVAVTKKKTLRKSEAEKEREIYLHNRRMEDLKAEYQKKVSQMEEEIQQRDLEILLRDSEILDLCKGKESLAQMSTEVKEKQEEELPQAEYSPLEQKDTLLEDRKEEMEKEEEEEETKENKMEEEEEKEEMCVKSESRWCVFLRKGVAALQKMKMQKKMKKREKEEKASLKKQETDEKMEKEEEEEEEE